MSIQLKEIVFRLLDMNLFTHFAEKARLRIYFFFPSGMLNMIIPLPSSRLVSTL